MSDATGIAAAEARAAAARQRLTSTVGELQDRLAPQALVKEAADTLSDAGRRALDTGVETARANPAAVMGGGVLLAMFLARKRLWSFVRRKT